jgi:signal transduction histidine kinase
MQEAVDTLARMLDVPFAEVFELDGERGLEVLARHIASGLDTEGEGEGEGIISVIAGRDRPLGAVGVQENGRSFTREDVNFLQAVANVLGAAMTRQREEQLDAKLEGARRLEAVGLLAGGLAHDFNNLLSVMLNYAQFAIDASGDRPELRADLNEIVSAAERASELAGQLLIFSGQDLLHTELTDLNGVIADCRPTLQSLLGDGTSVQLELADDLWPVTAGPGQPAQIARTLAANARDAMPHGGVVTLKTENIRFAEGDEAGGMEPPPGRFVRLTVADTGTGMSDEVAERAFDLFFTTKPIGAGAGLGLPTVYGIAKQLGGFVQIYSEAGQGTAVKVYLPAANSVFAEAEGTETQTAMGHGETILVVDDEDALRRLTERILSGNGYRVIGATDVDTALAAWAEHESVVDLLVTDVVMAGMSGAQLAERFRRSRPELPVLFMSGYTRDMLQIEGVGHRIAVLEKPFSSEGLLREVRAALEGSIG